MKKQIQFLLLALMASIASWPFYSCGDDEKDEPAVRPSFSCERTQRFNELGGSLECSVYNGNSSTTVESTVSWITATLNGSHCHMEISENGSGSQREGTVKLLSGGMEVDAINFTQEGSQNGGDEPGGGGGAFGAPTGLSLSKDGCSVTLTWDRVPKALRYYIYYSNPVDYDSGDFVTMNSTTSNSFTMDCRLAGKWAFKVQAFDGENRSGFSSTVRTTITESDINGGSGSGSGSGSTEKPGKPTGLKANVDGSRVSVSWNSASGASYYRLYYVKPAPYDIESFDNVYSTSITMDCTIKGTWTIWVVGVGSNGEIGDPSSKVTFSINSTGGGSGSDSGGSDKPKQLATPTGLKVNSTASDSYVQLQCNAVALGYDYQLYRSTRPGSGYTKINASVGSNASGSIIYFTDSNPRKGTTYYKVKVAALPSLGIKDSDYSDYVTVER